MTHRAVDILAAGASLLSERVTPKGWKVFKHRREKLTDAEGKTGDDLPAFSFDYGDDQPAAEQSLNNVNSALNIVVTAVATGPTEDEVRDLLFLMRDEQQGLMLDHMFSTSAHKFGLTFVYGIGYGGASAPDINADGEFFVGSLASTWTVGYRLR